ncbi:LCP family protein [Ornithinibacillus salinisoli]|uniref:LCP family protein n=1 Tax=Ornithinibacillus salinisoli TaxID=1848459 RepID=A0ABW4VZJ0_9BACI
MTKNKIFKKRYWIIGCIILVIILSVSGGYLTHLYIKTENMVNESQEEIIRESDKSQLRSEKVNPVQDNVSVLFLGIDTSEHRNYGEKSRTDAIILATFNKQDHSVKLLTIPRDTYVYVPEVNYNTKINHAHFYGGPKATLETVEEFLHIPVDYYVRMNFDAFVEVVDALDGVMFDVPYEIIESDSHDQKKAIHLSPGYQKLNGEEALALARTRKYDSDVDRGKRQQEMIKAIVSKATSLTSVLKLSNIVDSIGDNLTTNLSFQEIRGFISYGLDKEINIDTLNFKGSGIYMDGAWFYKVEEESRKQIQQELNMHLNLSMNFAKQLLV